MDGSTIPSTQNMRANAIMPSSSLMAYILGLRPILQRYEQLPETETPSEFGQLTLRTLGVFCINEAENLEQIMPKTGPLVVFSNHPFGGIEGVIMAAKCGMLRPDFKLIANRMLYQIPELRPMIIPINMGAKSQKENFAAVRMAVRHVEKGGAVGLFPSGVVAHWNMLKMGIIEPSWYSLCGRLARVQDVTALPIFFKGGNSFMFHAAGCIHPLLRTMLLPRELWRMRGRTIRFAVGKPIDSKLLAALPDDKARTAHMRVRCELLGKTSTSLPKIWSTPVAEPCDAQVLKNEIQKYLQDNPLVVEKNYALFAFNGKDSKPILNEICRQREETFRLVGEGSGQERDMDQFDSEYTHLVLWDTEAERLVGAYRVRSFEPTETKDIDNKLYTASLFTYQQAFFAKCQKSMELGRAFVVPEYQRDYVPLFLLWKGIARLTHEQKIRTLFGPCSMGLGYADASGYMLRQYLKENHWHTELSSLAKGKREPAEFEGYNVPDISGLDYKGCNRAVKDVEGDKGLPILFKHYLQLGGRIAAFHEDREFGTLDALLVVDLANSPEKTLLRYLTAQELAELRESFVE